MSNSENEDDVPSAEECDKICQSFASITGTDSALAFCVLKNEKWSLQKAVNAYFDSVNSKTSLPGVFEEALPLPRSSSSTIPVKASTSGVQAQSSSSLVDSKPSQTADQRVRIISWNIDGLDTNNIQTRTKAACETILREKADVVFLQEVVPDTLSVIEEQCPMFQAIPSAHEGYFTAMLLNIESVTYQEHNVKQFYSSMMSRTLLSCQVVVKGVDMTLHTTHLESTAAHATERKKQLTTLLQKIKESPDKNTVIAGGDLNMRDKELSEVGGLPENVLDLWEVTGKRQIAKFTWDLMRNDNLEWGKKFKPRCRFDRLYIRHPVDGEQQLKPVYFELVGIERIPACGRFPSDHWGLLAHLDKVV